MAEQPTPRAPNGLTARLKLLALTAITLVALILGSALLLVIAGQAEMAEQLIVFLIQALSVLFTWGPA